MSDEEYQKICRQQSINWKRVMKAKKEFDDALNEFYESCNKVNKNE